MMHTLARATQQWRPPSCVQGKLARAQISYMTGPNTRYHELRPNTRSFDPMAGSNFSIHATAKEGRASQEWGHQDLDFIRAQMDFRSWPAASEEIKPPSNRRCVDTKEAKPTPKEHRWADASFSADEELWATPFCQSTTKTMLDPYETYLQDILDCDKARSFFRQQQQQQQQQQRAWA